MAKNSHSYQTILSDLTKRKFEPVYFLCGEEPYFIDAISNWIEEHVLNEGEKGFNQSVFYGKDLDAKTLAAAARRFPMMASHQVIIVKEAQNLKGIDELASYLEQPSTTTILVLCYKGKTPDKRTKFGKLAEGTVYLESKKLYENQVAAWVETYLQSKGIKANERALALVVENLGTELSRIANELDKVILNLGEQKLITEKEVTEAIGINRDYNVFELQSALAVRDFEKCIRIVQYFSHSKNQFGKPVLLLGTLHSYFSKVYQVHAAQGTDDRTLAGILGVNPFFVKEYQTAARNYPPQKLESVFQTLMDADLKSKGITGGSDEDDDILKELVIKLFN